MSDRHTTLDTVGRPVQLIKMRNVVTEHNVNFTVDYRFNVLLMAHEPMLLVTGSNRPSSPPRAGHH